MYNCMQNEVYYYLLGVMDAQISTIKISLIKWDTYNLQSNKQ